jgi:hypothetical protein
MDARTDALVAFVGAIVLFLPIFIVCMSGKHWKAAQEKERQRRLTDAKMNAVLLRMNI